MARPLKYEGRDLHLALFGQPEPRDNYIGEFRPAVVEPREPLRLVHMRRTGNAVLLAVADAHNVLTMLSVETPDDARMQALSAADRNRVHSALLTIHRQEGPPDAA